MNAPGLEPNAAYAAYPYHPLHGVPEAVLEMAREVLAAAAACRDLADADLAGPLGEAVVAGIMPAVRAWLAPPPEPLSYSVHEAASLLGVTDRWLAAEARAGRVPYVRIARGYRFTRAQLEEILADRSVQVTPAEVRRLPARRRPPRA